MLGFIWRMPWFVYVILSVGALAFGFFLQQDVKQLNIARAIALEGPPPEAISVDKVSQSSFTNANEITVRSQLLLDVVYTVSVSGRRTIDKEKVAIFSLSENAADKTEMVNVVYMLDTDVELAQFMDKFTTGQSGPISKLVEVNGEKYLPGRKLANVVSDAAKKSGLVLSSDVQFIEPFMSGRKAALQPRSQDTALGFMIIIALVLFAYGIIRFLFSRRRQSQMATQSQ